MFCFSVMAFGGCEGDKMEEKMRCKNSNLADKKINDISSHNRQDAVNIEKSLDDFINNSDSLSSSASVSDSDLTSTDSDDSLALSESESITDVTPLNSPYCDSPLCPSRVSEHKLDDRSVNRNLESGMKREGCEGNILMQAIEKLEIEAKKGEQPTPRGSSSRRRTLSYGGEDVKRIEQENQRLFKRVIAQQNRMRALYSCPNQPWKNMKHPDLVKSDGDITKVLQKSIQSPKNLKDPTRHSQRQQKCLSHPSYMFSCGPVSSKVLSEDSMGKGDKKVSENSVLSSASRACNEAESTSSEQN